MKNRITKVKDILFPSIGSDINIINDVDLNLESALYDLKRLKADKVCISTIEDVLEQLYKARRIIEKGR